MEEPENLIPREKMSDILYDMALLDAIDNSYPQVLSENDLKVMEFLFKKYGIDSLQFVQSDLYYASVPAAYQKIYEAVEERLTQKRDSISEVIRQGQSQASDSLDREEGYE
jgi:(p)ppGpp synthase/HD superfamily hydrolase